MLLHTAAFRTPLLVLVFFLGTSCNVALLDYGLVGDPSQPNLAGDLDYQPPSDTGDTSDDSMADQDVVSDSGPESDPAGPLECDSGFTFLPSPVETGRILEVRFATTVKKYSPVVLNIVGPGIAKSTGGLLISDQSPWSWKWLVTLNAGGVWTFTFSAGSPLADIATCRILVTDTGTPPELPIANCVDKVCGDDDGAGGFCKRCLMVASEGGACFDPPSPIGPSGSGPWSCLDSANCKDWGQCKIWCPAEPCRTDLYPEGCPQAVEVCWVDPNIDDYEEACRQCCQSRFHNPNGQYACWDDAYNICRYPGDCGKPYPLP